MAYKVKWLLVNKTRKNGLFEKHADLWLQTCNIDNLNLETKQRFHQGMH